MKPRPIPDVHEVITLALVAGAGGVAGAAMREGAQCGFEWLGQPAWSSRIVVNVIGGGLAGWFVGLSALPEATDPLPVANRPLRRVEHLVLTGFLGGFTTISGFAWDVAAMAQDWREWPVSGSVAMPGSMAGGSPLVGLAIVLVSNGVAGVAAAWLGLALGRCLNQRGRPNRA